jgi:hypothetical protein
MVERSERPINLNKKPKDEGPERPDDDSQIGVAYLNFEDLQPLPAEQINNTDSFFEWLRG